MLVLINARSSLRFWQGTLTGPNNLFWLSESTAEEEQVKPKAPVYDGGVQKNSSFKLVIKKRERLAVFQTYSLLINLSIAHPTPNCTGGININYICFLAES